MLKTASARRAPRQLSAEKEQLLLDTAREVFQEQGVGNATMDEIANRAGISKATIYRRYESKTDLFEKVVQESSKSIASQISMFTLDPAAPKESLLAAARLIRNVVQENVEYQRLLISEARRHRELCQQARSSMNSLAVQKLAAFYTTLLEQGRMTHTDIESATWTFFVLAAGGFRTLYNIDVTSKAEQRRWLADIDLFVRGCGIQD